MLAMIAVYFVQRALRGGMDTPAVWGATGATVAIDGLQILTTISIVTGESMATWVRAALSTIGVIGILQFWLFYRRVIVIDPKQGKAMGT